MVSEKQESGTDFGPAAQISQISEICRLRGVGDQSRFTPNPVRLAEVPAAIQQ
jgi:hypothetical protein